MIPPIKNFNWTKNTAQLFGVNKELYYPNFRLPGHNGIDIVVPPDSYGVEIVATHDGRITQWNIDDPTRKNGNGLFLQGYDGDQLVQTCYWHLSRFNINPGQEVKAGDVIGYIGNTGFVRPEPSDSCPHCGAHLHFGVTRIKTIPPGTMTTEAIKTDYGFYCDPVPFIFKAGDKLPVRFNRDLFIGREGDDVSHLQTILKIEGFAKDYEPIGYFGNKTRRDVSLLQAKYGINPVLGYCGSKTRALLNTKYSGY
jgi:hypothetical protein